MHISSLVVWKNPNINLLSDGIHTKLGGNNYYPSGGVCVGILVRISLFQGDLSVLFTTLNGSHQKLKLHDGWWCGLFGSRTRDLSNQER